MNQDILLFSLRLLGALVLLAFLAILGWFLYQELAAAARLNPRREQPTLFLRVLASGNTQPQTGALLPVYAVTSIGRAAGNHVVIDDQYASAEHILLAQRGRQWWLEDLGSRNGTQLNDAPLESATAVNVGDVITIGLVKLRLETAAGD